VTSCTRESHAELAAEVASATTEAELRTAAARAWWATRRAWEDAGLVIGECLCKSTVAIEDPNNPQKD
jgi:hypothetical protein